MSRKSQIALLIGGALLLATLFFFFNHRNGKKSGTVPTVYSSDWTAAYRWEGEGPYHLYFTSLALQKHLGKKHQLSKIESQASFHFAMKRQEAANFLFIGETFALREAEMDSLMTKVHQGSHVFIASKWINRSNLAFFMFNFKTYFDYSSKLNLQVDDQTYTFYHQFQADTLPKDWDVMLEASSPLGDLDTLSTISGYPNAISVAYGKGKITYSLTPELYQNLHLNSLDGKKHLNATLLHELPADREVYLLDFAQLGKNIPDESVQDEERDASYLQFILKQKAFIYALFFLSIALVLFLLFRTKRMEPVVPILPKQKNRTLLFLDTLTSIYQRKQNPNALLTIQKRNFQTAILKHFYIDLTHTQVEQSLLNLSHKVKIPKEEIEQLYQRLCTTDPVHEGFIHETAKLQRAFYVKSGIIKNQFNILDWNHPVRIYDGLLLAGLLVWAGIALMLFGVSLLIAGQGSGILVVILAISVLFFGGLRLQTPLLEFSPEQITIFSFWGSKKSYQWHEIKEIEKIEQEYRLIPFTGRTFHWQMSRKHAMEQIKLDQLITLNRK